MGQNPLRHIDPLGLNPATTIGMGIGTSIMPGAGTVVGVAVGTMIGIGIGGAADYIMQQSIRPPGAIDAIPGAKEWGRRNGVKNAIDIFHDIKRANRNKPGSKAADKCSVNPDTGDVYDAQGEYIGNLGKDH